jgi:hypothetical protein
MAAILDGGRGYRTYLFKGTPLRMIQAKFGLNFIALKKRESVRRIGFLAHLCELLPSLGIRRPSVNCLKNHNLQKFKVYKKSCNTY